MTNKPTFLDPYSTTPREDCLKVSLLISKSDVAFIRGISPHESVFRIFANLIISKAINELKNIGITTYDERFERAIASATVQFLIPGLTCGDDVIHKGYVEPTSNNITSLDGRTSPLARPASTQGHDGRAATSVRPQEPDVTAVGADVERTAGTEGKGKETKRKTNRRK